MTGRAARVFAALEVDYSDLDELELVHQAETPMDDPTDDRRTNPAYRFDGDQVLTLGVGNNRLRPPRHNERGGEWDPVRALPTTTRRSLASAGYITRRGIAPDQLALVLAESPLGHQYDTDELVDWYVTHALEAIRFRQSRGFQLAQEQARRARLAAAHGHATHYDYRTADSRSRGFTSLWDRRRNHWAPTAQIDLRDAA